MNKFKATHRLYNKDCDGKLHYEPVQLVDSILYTRLEWETCSQADWELNDEGTLLFQGGRNYPHQSIWLTPLTSRQRQT